MMGQNRPDAMRRAVRSCFPIAALLVASVAYGQFPEPDDYVFDGANVLEPADEDYLEDYLATLERQTGSELAVATVTTLDGMSIEEYAVRLFEHVIFPEFAAGNLRRGVGRGVDRIAAVLRRDPNATTSTGSSNVNGGWWWLFVLPPVVMLAATIVAVVMRIRRGQFVPGAAGATATDSSSWSSDSSPSFVSVDSKRRVVGGRRPL